MPWASRHPAASAPWQDALPYLELVASEHLGPGSTVSPERFRIGASSLLGDIEAVLGRQPTGHASGQLRSAY
jgi:hypothetical protein